MAQPARPARQLQAGEVVYLETPDGVLVTSKRVVVAGTTYPLQNITSVRAETVDRRVVNPAATRRWRLVLSGVVVADMAIVAAVTVAGSGFALAMLVAYALLTAILVGLVWFYTQVTRTETVHAVVLTTAGRDVEAIVGCDRTAADEAVEAINRAVVG